MSGRWIEPIHSCDPPFNDVNNRREGDRWQCDCGRIWTVASITLAGVPTLTFSSSMGLK